MSNVLTNRDFWLNYWQRKTGLAIEILENYLFHKQLTAIIEQDSIKTAIELGGFPGYYAVYLKKYHDLDVTLLDFFIYPPITSALLAANGLQANDVEIIEADLFAYTPQKQYDLVLSCGLIEHFTDTKDIIKRHMAFLKPGGGLFITLPNFRGINGWFQLKFDKENYDKHNINCMDPELLETICKDLGLKVLRSEYFGKFSVWLENEKEKPIWVKAFKKTVWILGKVFTRVFSFETKQLSPYIMVYAKKV